MSEKDRLGHELNSTMKWNFSDPIPLGIKVFILYEADTCDPTIYPAIRLAIRESYSKPGYGNIKLLDFDPETEDEYLHTNPNTIIAWRTLTDHGGTWYKYFSEHPEENIYNYKMNP